MTTYEEAVAYFESLAQFGEKLDLGRMRRLCELAGHPEGSFRSVLVGGTNGKGSTCAMLAGILQAAEYRVGMAPKPHLQTYRERLQVNGELISDERLGALVAQVRPWVAAVAAEPELGQPTVFEVITLLAFLHFAAEHVDWAVIEVGLGGRFDATNVLEPELAIITNVGLDHTERLGDTVEKIAFEKAGIIHAGSRAVTGAVGGALAVIERAAAERQAALWRLGHEVRLLRAELSTTGGKFDVGVQGRVLEALRVGLLGRHQLPNACVAVAAALWLVDTGATIPEEAIRRGLERARHPGRLEVIAERPAVLLDGAHNPDGARALRRALEELFLPIHPDGCVILVLGIGTTHAVDEIVGTLAPIASVVIATASRHPRASSPDTIAAAARPHCSDVRLSSSVAEACREAVSLARPQDIVVIAGSLFVVAEVPGEL